MKYELIDHTADLGFHIYGQNREDLFQHAAEALSSLLIDTVGTKETETVNMTLTSDTLEDLFMNWLRTLLSLFTIKHVIVISTRVLNISETSLTADVTTVHFDPYQDELKTEVKAITYHGLCVKKTGGTWLARVILDV